MPQIRCRLILMAPDAHITANDPDALAGALDGGDVAAIVAAAQSPGFPPLGEEALGRAQARGIACLKMKDDICEDLTGFDGVHLGVNADHTAIQRTRQILGGDALIGAEAGKSRDDAMRRGEAGVDYIAFAPQEDDETPSLELVSWWCDLFVIPCVAMGKITLQNAAPLIRAGVDFLMLPAGIWREPGSAAAIVADFNRLIDETDRS